MAPAELLGLDIITAVLPEGAQHLRATAESILRVRDELSQRGSTVSWHLVLDGPADEDEIDPLIRTAAASLTIMGRRYGVSVARNIALTRCTSPLVTPLDGDDLIEPQGALEAVTLLTTTSDIGWVGGGTDILNQSAARTHPEEQTARTRRHWPAGTLRYAPERPWVGDRDAAFCPGAVILRTQHVWEAGGWPASPAAEDKALLLKISRRSAGEQIAAALLTYRIWDQQATGSARYSPDMIELGATFNLRTLAALPNSPAAANSAPAQPSEDVRPA